MPADQTLQQQSGTAADHGGSLQAGVWARGEQQATGTGAPCSAQPWCDSASTAAGSSQSVWLCAVSCCFPCSCGVTTGWQGPVGAVPSLSQLRTVVTSGRVLEPSISSSGSDLWGGTVRGQVIYCLSIAVNTFCFTMTRVSSLLYSVCGGVICLVNSLLSTSTWNIQCLWFLWAFIWIAFISNLISMLYSFTAFCLSFVNRLKTWENFLYGCRLWKRRQSK